MKRTALFVSAAIALGAFAWSCSNGTEQAAETKTETTSKNGEIVYFDLDRVLSEYQMSIDLQTEVKGKVDAIQKDLDRKQKKFEREYTQFIDNMQRNLMTQVVAQEKGQKLQEEKNNLDALIMNKSHEIQMMQQDVLNKIAFAVGEYLKEFNEEKQYAMIISTQGDILKAPVCLGREELDITDDLVEGLNEQYAKGLQAVADSVSTK